MGCTTEKSKTGRKISTNTQAVIRELGRASRDYEFKKIIGHGRYGRVLLGENLTTSQRVAIKAICKEHTTLACLTDEIKILSEVDHPNIVKYIEHFDSDKYLYIVMEFCQGGDLFQKILEKEKFNEAEAAILMNKLLRAINHCHHLGIIHRDLKPENIMFSSEGLLKIIDFGLSMKDKSLSRERLAGTAYYIAPEILKDEVFTKSCDIWSLGVIMHILLSGYVPIAGKTIEEVYDRIILYSGPNFEGAAWKTVSEEAKKLIRLMMEPDYKKRITAAEALKHPWFVIDKEEGCNLEILEALKKYSGYTKLKKKALNLLVKNVNEAEIQKFQQAFFKMDKDKTGLIKCNDIKECLKKSGHPMTADELEKLTRKINYNGDAFINYTEFLSATIATQQFLTDEKLWTVFKALDVEKQGEITEESLKIVLTERERLRSAEAADIIMKADTDGDGKITFDDFKRILQE